MKLILSLVMASVLAASGAWADDAHHPEAAASAAKASKPAPKKAAAKAPLKKADQQMMAMRDMHEKMMNAKTPEERNALMAEHMKAMQGGMAMMGDMATASKNGMAEGKSSDLAACHQMMEKRMEMMESMMQMMMDRLPPPAGQ